MGRIKALSAVLGFAAISISASVFGQTAVTTSGGTATAVPVFTGSATLGNSPIAVASGNVGIGTASPNALFSVGAGSPFQVTSAGVLNSTAGINAITYAGNTQLTNTGVTSNFIFSPTLTTTFSLNGVASSNVLSMAMTGGGTNTSPYMTVQGNHYTQFASNGSQSGATVQSNSFEVGGGSTAYTNVSVSSSGANLYKTSSNITNLSIFNGSMSYNGGGYTGTLTNLYGLYLGPMTGATNSYAIYSAGGQSYFAGNIGIGTATPGAALEVKGSVKLTAGSGGGLTFADGTVQTTAFNPALCGADYAESVGVTGDRTRYEPGDVLVIDADAPGKFLKSNLAYSTLVAGIYSTQPGFVGRLEPAGSEASKAEVPMAMVGRVPTKVSAENGPIKVGDLLVSSSTVGYAMKGTDRGRMLGAVIGKALGSLDAGTGVIQVLVTLQ